MKTAEQQRCTVEEARKILGVVESTGLKQIDEKFEKMFNANDPANGGTFYIQSKIVRAKEAIHADMNVPFEMPAPTPAKAAPAAEPSVNASNNSDSHSASPDNAAHKDEK